MMTCFDYHYHYYQNPLRLSCFVRFVQVRSLNLLYNALELTNLIRKGKLLMYSSSSSSCRRFTVTLFFRKTVEIERFASLACVASVSARVRRESWDESIKTINYGGGEGREGNFFLPLLLSPSSFHFFCSRPNFRA